jgi:hypothetical protein
MGKNVLAHHRRSRVFDSHLKKKYIESRTFFIRCVILFCFVFLKNRNQRHSCVFLSLSYTNKKETQTIFCCNFFLADVCTWLYQWISLVSPCNSTGSDIRPDGGVALSDTNVHKTVVRFISLSKEEENKTTKQETNRVRDNVITRWRQRSYNHSRDSRWK